MKNKNRCFQCFSQNSKSPEFGSSFINPIGPVQGDHKPWIGRYARHKTHGDLKTNTPSQQENPEPVILASRYIFGA